MFCSSSNFPGSLGVVLVSFPAVVHAKHKMPHYIFIEVFSWEICPATCDSLLWYGAEMKKHQNIMNAVTVGQISAAGRYDWLFSLLGSDFHYLCLCWWCIEKRVRAAAESLLCYQCFLRQDFAEEAEFFHSLSCVSAPRSAQSPAAASLELESLAK